MAYIGRLAGAILVQTGESHFLVGDCKEPCDFEAAGFMPVAERNVLERPYVPIEILRPIVWQQPLLWSSLEGERLPQKLVDSFLIFRNGSVSERLWRMVIAQSKSVPQGEGGTAYDINWLTQLPNGIWEIVRDQILRC